MVHALLNITISTALLTTTASEPADRVRNTERETRLLDMYADQGIDADADGALTCDEVSAFFADPANGPKKGTRAGRRFRGQGRGRGHGHMGFGRGHEGFGLFGRQGQGFGSQGGLRAAFERLESETPPDRFNLERHPNADLDGDGALSSEEWRSFADARIDRMVERILDRHSEADADGNGKLSDEELASFIESREAIRNGRVLNRAPEADSDADGVLSSEEFDAWRDKVKAERTARFLERHPDADANGDGELSIEERRAWREENRGGRRFFRAGRRPRG